MIYAKETYNVLAFWGDVDTMTTVFNTVNDKYNGARWRDYASWAPRLRTPDYKVNVVESNLNVAAAVISANGQKPLRGIKGWSEYAGTIPLIGHSFKMSAEDFMMLRHLEASPNDPNGPARFSFIERFDKLVAGMHTRLNMFVYQALSSGYVISDNQNGAEEGVRAMFDLRFDPEHRWVPKYGLWTNFAVGGSNPIQDMQDMQDYFDDEAIPYTNWLMTRKLVQTLANNPNVTTMLARKMRIIDPQDYPFTREEVRTQLSALFGIAPIIEIDEKSAIELDGKSVTVSSFDPVVATLCAPADFFNMMNCRNIFESENSPTIAKTSVENDRFSVIVEYASNPVSNTCSIESYVLPVPKNPRNIGLIKTDTTEEWGTREWINNGGEVPDFNRNTTKTIKSVDGNTVLVNGEVFTRERIFDALDAIGETANRRLGAKQTQKVVDALDETKTAALYTQLGVEE